ncbi:MAG: biosynthetic-type acetolactate synthase large subunit [Sutterella sp.]|nr:biosynthetic-type acetolactate synthase large subunit [Sutterella sp.]
MQSSQAENPFGSTLTGAQILVESLHCEGVRHIFGYPGGTVLPLYDAIHQQTHFDHILVRHEQAALHAADAYARSSGQVGVAVVTSGPGATNAVTGIATAYADSIPLVVITGQVSTGLIGTDAFQECDTIGITRPCVKHNFLVKHVEDLAVTVKKAFHIARTGRPGPVIIDLPKDIQTSECVFEYPDMIEMPNYRPTTRGHSGQIKRALTALLEAERPLIYVGGGAVSSDAHDILNEFLDAVGAPVVSTLLGLGAVRPDNPHYLGMVGMHGTYEADMAMHYCDVLLAVGARFDDRVIGHPADFMKRERTVIHIDIDPSSISKIVHADVPIVGDVREVLTDALRMLGERRPDPALTAGWQSEIAQWRAKQSLAYAVDAKGPIKPQAVIERVGAYTKGEAWYATDVGQHQIWAAQYLKIAKPRHWLSSGGLGTMGYGLPAACGCAVAHPGEPVVCFTGDGSVQMNIQELGTAKQYGLAPKIFLLNNGYLGMVAYWQRNYYGGRLSASVMDVQPDFVKLAECYGHVGIRVQTYEELDKAIHDAFETYRDELVLIDVIIAPEEPVLPMVGPGLGLTDIVIPGEGY